MERNAPLRARRAGGASLGLFALLLVAYGWFHQGGGWNQNVRFAQVRALAHEARFAIDDQLLYAPAIGEDGRLAYRRLALSDPRTRSARLPRAVSLDVSAHGGHFYPNKPPGISLLALPGYLLLRALGLADDGAEGANLALHLTSLLSVALVSALGGVAFHDVTRRLFAEARATSRLAATLVYALGTPVFAYATFLIDHAVVASLSLLAFRSLLVARDRGNAGSRAPFVAGSFAGLAVLVNNSAAITALALGGFALAVLRPRARILAYVAGGVLPALTLAAYHELCFGSPFALPQHHQLGMFQTAAPLLGVFGTPRPELLPKLLFGAWRGLFFWSPVLLAGTTMLLLGLGDRRRRPEALLGLAIASAFLAMNASFNAWHGGGTFGPRYLVPAVPFLALPLVAAFERARVLTGALAAVSIALALLVTAVSPQLDAAERRPLTGFYLPLLRGGTLASAGHRLHGPVSVHPTGYVSGLEARRDDARARAASFNLGELVFPGSLWSLAPLVLIVGCGAALLGRRERAG